MKNQMMPVLFADDDENDRRLLLLAAEEAGWQNPILQFEDGRGVIEYLDHAGSKVPALIVLDVKMRNMGGFAVLAWLRARSDFDTVPTVVLSSSGLERDSREAFALGASGYCVKPARFTDLVRMMKNMRQKWLDGSDADDGQCGYLGMRGGEPADRGCLFRQP